MRRYIIHIYCETRMPSIEGALRRDLVGMQSFDDEDEMSEFITDFNEAYKDDESIDLIAEFDRPIGESED